MRVRVREDACWWHRGCRKLACQGPWGPVRHVRGPLVLAWPPPVKNRSRVSEIVEEKNRGRKQVQGARGREHTRHSLPLFPPSFLCGRRCWMCSVERSYKRVRGLKFRGWGSPSQVKKTRMFDSHFSVITPCVGYRRFVSQPLHTFLSLSLSFATLNLSYFFFACSLQRVNFSWQWRKILVFSSSFPRTRISRVNLIPF